MSGSPVFITGRLGTPFLQRIKALIPEAITRAIYRTRHELTPFLQNPFIVPYLTGRLQDSAIDFVSPGQIVIQWSAVDPISGFNYAKLRDEKGGILAPAGFSKTILQRAKELLRNNLELELGAMKP